MSRLKKHKGLRKAKNDLSELLKEQEKLEESQLL